MDIDRALDHLYSIGIQHNCPICKAAFVTIRTALASPPINTIEALADKWCDSTNQPDNICAALYQFTKWTNERMITINKP
jgi:hypothetical protein